MTLSGLLSIGECMIELSGGQDASYRQAFAGDTFNTAWHARQLLEPEISVGFFTAVGIDTRSQKLRGFCSASGIATDKIVTVADRQLGLYMIEQKDGDRHFSYWRENSAARLLAEDSKVLQAAFEGQALIYFSGITLAILSVGARLRIQDALKSAKSAGTRIAFDPNLRPSLWNDSNEMRATIESSAVISDIILPSYDDEAEHFGDADPAATCERYANLAGDGAEIIVKNGAEAVTIRHGGENVSFAVPSIKNIVDATGAGDAFNGGYLAARLMGRTRHEATSTAIRTSARVVSHHGAITR